MTYAKILTNHLRRTALALALLSNAIACHGLHDASQGESQTLRLSEGNAIAVGARGDYSVYSAKDSGGCEGPSTVSAKRIEVLTPATVRAESTRNGFSLFGLAPGAAQVRVTTDLGVDTFDLEVEAPTHYEAHDELALQAGLTHVAYPVGVDGLWFQFDITSNEGEPLNVSSMPFAIDPPGALVPTDGSDPAAAPAPSAATWGRAYFRAGMSPGAVTIAPALGASGTPLVVHLIELGEIDEIDARVDVAGSPATAAPPDDENGVFGAARAAAGGDAGGAEGATDDATGDSPQGGPVPLDQHVAVALELRAVGVTVLQAKVRIEESVLTTGVCAVDQVGSSSSESDASTSTQGLIEGLMIAGLKAGHCTVDYKVEEAKEGKGLHKRIDVDFVAATKKGGEGGRAAND